MSPTGEGIGVIFSILSMVRQFILMPMCCLRILHTFKIYISRVRESSESGRSVLQFTDQFGVQFESLTPEDEERLQAFIHTALLERERKKP